MFGYFVNVAITQTPPSIVPPLEALDVKVQGNKNQVVVWMERGDDQLRVFNQSCAHFLTF